MLKEIKPSPDSKVIKFLTFDYLVPATHDILAKARSRMTTATTFFRQ